MMQKKNRTWAEIDLDALVHNYRLAKERAGDRIVMCVIKADAYGHGVAQAARAFANEGVRHFAVATPEEALQLRRHGIEGDILLLGTAHPDTVEALQEAKITLTVSSESIAAQYEERLQKSGKTLKVHIKINSGMDRQGIRADEQAADRILQIREACPNLIIEGLYTHFAVADTPSGETFTMKQYEKTRAVVDALKEKGLPIALFHVANSAATFFYTTFKADMVRPGIMLYGSNPCPEKPVDLWPTMRLVTTISNVITVKKGETVSYGRTWKAERDSRIAVLGIGYADGLFRILSGKLPVLVHGQRVRQVGRICMDMCMIDVTDVADVQIGDTAVIIGRQGDEEITVDEIADLAGTISYEIFCAVGKRVPRVYIKDGQETEATCYIDVL